MGNAPSKRAIEDVVAGFWIRGLARILDSTIAALLGAAVTFGFTAASILKEPALVPASPGSLAPNELPSLAPIAFSLVAYVAFDVLGQAIGGATIGKAMCGLRVRSDDLGRCTWSEAIVRNLVAIVDTALFPITFFVMRGSKLQQRWGDRMAHTVVVRAKVAPPAPDAGNLTLGVILSLAAYGVGAVAADMYSVYERKGAAHRQELAVCDHERNGMARDNCLQSFAVRRKDASLCDQAGSPRERDECYADVAPKLGPPTCAQVGDLATRNGCYLRVARDAATCAKIDDTELQERCMTMLAQMARDPALCDSLKTARDSCRASVAATSGNADGCSAIQNPVAHDQCYSQLGQCDPIVQPGTRDQCYLAHDHGGDNCMKVTSPSTRAICLIGAASIKRDPSYCDAIDGGATDADMRRCYDGTFTFTKSVATCARFSDPVILEDCFFAVANNTRDATLCAKVHDPARKLDCLSRTKH